MITISISEFKKHCLSLIDTIRESNEQITITKFGKPVAKVIPLDLNDLGENELKGSILFEKDIVSPIDKGWKPDG